MNNVTPIFMSLKVPMFVVALCVFRPKTLEGVREGIKGACNIPD